MYFKNILLGLWPPLPPSFVPMVIIILCLLFIRLSCTEQQKCKTLCSLYLHGLLHGRIFHQLWSQIAAISSTSVYIVSREFHCNNSILPSGRVVEQ